MLPPDDAAFLERKGWTHEVAVEGGVVCLVVTAWPVPSGYNVDRADVLIHLPGGYPDVPLDMWWFAPALVRADGRLAPATEQFGTYLGRTWQRWSRHLGPNQWRSGVDGLETYFARIRSDLIKYSGVAA